MKKSKNDEPKCNNSSRRNNFHVPKQAGTSVNHGWDRPFYSFAGLDPFVSAIISLSSAEILGTQKRNANLDQHSCCGKTLHVFAVWWTL